MIFIGRTEGRIVESNMVAVHASESLLPCCEQIAAPDREL